MNLNDADDALEAAIDAQLAGESPDVPAELRDDFARAIEAHELLQAIVAGDAAPHAVAELDAAPDRPPPTLPGDYEIVRELGRGGMGVVYLARQKSLSRDVAVKVMRPGDAAFSRVVKRFMEEARHLARLRHPNIVSIHEIGRADNEPYFTMDYVDGEPLSAILKRPAHSRLLTQDPAAAETKSFLHARAPDAPAAASAARSTRAKRKQPLSPTQALAILKQAAAAVEHAHEHGIIHRDLKPGNILVEPSGRAFVTDFGLARDMAESSQLTHSGQMMGTPAYMAPEQAQGKKELIGEATDIHALGVILYEMLTGELPYGNDAPASIIVRLLTHDPTPPRKLDRRIPRDLETICLKAMAKTPDGRYASVRALLEDIRRFESGEPVLARRPGRLARTARFARRHWKSAAAVVLPAAVVLAATLALAPRWFDKSVDELVQWGKEQYDAEHNEVALQAFVRAFKMAPPEQRPDIMEWMLLCARGVKDQDQAVGILKEALDVDPDASFQEFDFQVAVAKFDRPFGELSRLPLDDKRRFLEFAEKRLTLVTSSSYCTPTEKQKAAKYLDDVRRQLAALKTTPGLVLALPTGDPQELLQRAANRDNYEWTRGMSAFGAGAELENAGDKTAALAAYRQAYDLMRQAFPTYAGRVPNWNHGRESGPDVDMEECQLLREVHESIHRLDPSAPDMLRGGIRFKIVGVKLPRNFVSFLQVTLHDPAIKYPQYFPTPNGDCPLQIDQTAWVGVADGKYKLAVYWPGVFNTDVAELKRYNLEFKTKWEEFAKSNGRSPNKAELKRLGLDTSDESLGAGFELELDDVPSEVEIAGDTKQITIRAYPRQEFRRLEPAAGQSVDLRTATFRWASLPGAASYHVEFDLRVPIPSGFRYTSLLQVNTGDTSLTPSQLPPGDAKKLAALTSGRQGSWSVWAYDAKGRRLGYSTGDGAFKVDHGLNEP